MTIEWIIFCRAFKNVGDNGPSIIGLITKFGAPKLPVTMDMALAIRFTGTSGEKAEFAFHVVDEQSKVVASGKLPVVVIPYARDFTDAGIPIKLKIERLGRFTVAIHSTSGSQSKIAWFDVDPGVVH